MKKIHVLALLCSIGILLIYANCAHPNASPYVDGANIFKGIDADGLNWSVSTNNNHQGITLIPLSDSFSAVFGTIGGWGGFYYGVPAGYDIGKTGSNFLQFDAKLTDMSGTALLVKFASGTGTAEQGGELNLYGMLTNPTKGITVTDGTDGWKTYKIQLNNFATTLQGNTVNTTKLQANYAKITSFIGFWNPGKDNAGTFYVRNAFYTDN